MLTSFFPIFIAVVIAFALAAVISILAGILGPHKPSRHKLEPYESGIVPEKPVLDRFDIRYYIVAIMFIAFDVEMIFIYPWAVAMEKLGLFGFVEMLISIAIILIAYFYAFRHGVFDWYRKQARIKRPDNPWQSGGME